MSFILFIACYFCLGNWFTWKILLARFSPISYKLVLMTGTFCDIEIWSPDLTYEAFMFNRSHSFQMLEEFEVFSTGTGFLEHMQVCTHNTIWLYINLFIITSYHITSFDTIYKELLFYFSSKTRYHIIIFNIIQYNLILYHVIWWIFN